MVLDLGIFLGDFLYINITLDQTQFLVHQVLESHHRLTVFTSQKNEGEAHVRVGEIEVDASFLIFSNRRKGVNLSFFCLFQHLGPG